MTLERTRPVIDALVRGVLPLVFLFQSVFFSENLPVKRWQESPSASPGWWSAAKVHRVPRHPVPSAAMVADVPAPGAPSSALRPSVTWGDFPRNVTGILERLRGELRSDVSLADFHGPGTIDTFWTWLGTTGPSTPVGMKASLRYVPTPFGNSLNLNLFMTSGETQFAFSLLNQTNSRAYFPGVNVELYEFPFLVANNPVLVTPRLGLWFQPPGQSTDSGVWKWGGLWLVSLEVPLEEGFGLWLEGSGKTEGWAPGIDDASGGWSLRTGFHWML